MGISDKRILIIDDEQDVRDMLVHCLKKVGYSVFSAANGRDGIHAAILTKPQLIIMDMMMPAMNGLEACRILRNMVAFKNVVIVFLTARSDEQSEVAGFEAGADDFIAKPIKLQAFVNRVAAMLQRGNRTEIEPRG